MLLEKRLGLDRPFIVRSFGFLKDAMTLNLGRADMMISDSGSKTVRLILLERLPATLVLWGFANLLLFFMSLFVALFLSRRYGSVMDRIIITLAPTSAAPAWFYGLFLILIFAAIFQILPFGSMVDAPPPENPVAYGLSLAKHLILPVGAILISAFFLTTYNWRTFFLIYSSEDYVEMAKAKGLSSTGDRATLCSQANPAHHYHPVCTDADHAVARGHHPGDGIQLARARPGALPGHRAVRYARHRGLDRHLCLSAGAHSLSPGLHLRSGRSQGENRKRGHTLMKRLRSTLKELTAYPSAVVGLVIVIALVVISIVTVIALPYDEAVRSVAWGGRGLVQLPQDRGTSLDQYLSEAQSPRDDHCEH